MFIKKLTEELSQEEFDNIISKIKTDPKFKEKVSRYFNKNKKFEQRIPQEDADIISGMLHSLSKIKTKNLNDRQRLLIIKLLNSSITVLNRPIKHISPISNEKINKLENDLENIVNDFYL